MALPGVTIQVADGALGRTVATDDGVAALVVTGVAATGLALNVAARIYSLADAIALGITATTHPHAYGQISDFYGQAGAGAELWIMLVSEATTHTAVFVATTGPMQKLIDASQGRVTIAATSMGRTVGYTPTMVGLVDWDIPAVAAQAQTIANGYAMLHQPVSFILDGSYLLNPLTGVINIKGLGDRISVFVGNGEVGKRSATMGRFLGRLAAIPVHQSIARVKTGPFAGAGALTSGLALSAYSNAQLASLHDAGYIALRTLPGMAGVFVTKDVTLGDVTKDFTSIALRRVMDKAIRLMYQTYLYELNDTIEIGADGKLLPTKVSYIEDIGERVLRTRMLAEGNCSDISVVVDPAQNVIATETLYIGVWITPLGSLEKIFVKLGYYNPANA